MSYSIKIINNDSGKVELDESNAAIITGAVVSHKDNFYIVTRRLTMFSDECSPEGTYACIEGNKQVLAELESLMKKWEAEQPNLEKEE